MRCSCTECRDQKAGGRDISALFLRVTKINKTTAKGACVGGRVGWRPLGIVGGVQHGWATKYAPDQRPYDTWGYGQDPLTPRQHEGTKGKKTKVRGISPKQTDRSGAKGGGGVHLSPTGRAGWVAAYVGGSKSPAQATKHPRRAVVASPNR